MNANQIVEKKADTPEKLAAAAGKPTRNFLFARELNEIVARLRILWTLQNFNGSQIIPGLKKDLGTLVGQTFVEKINTSVATPFASPSYVVYTIGDVNYTQAFVGAEGAKGNGAGQVDAVDFLLVEQSDEPVEPVLNNPANYSLEELNTGGTWIDGKPIYRKTVDLPIPTTRTPIIELDSFFLNIDSICDDFKIYYNSMTINDSEQIGAANVGLNIVFAVTRFNYPSDPRGPYILSVGPLNPGGGTQQLDEFDAIRITLEYTKTTD